MTQSKSIQAGRYEVLREIGSGGFATVYEARDTRLDRTVALKVLHPQLTTDSKFVQRFKREARTAANLRHPNFVLVHDFGDADGSLYLAMEFIGTGYTLCDLLAEQGPLSLEQALPILAQLANALDYLHRLDPPLTHRDVKPANVLLEGEEDNLRVVLTDFGLVRSMEDSAELTASGTVLGTPAYMAPEQVLSEQWGEITPLTDVYGLGVVAYEMLTGRVPFEGKPLAVMHAHVNELPPSPLEFVPNMDDYLVELLTRSLAKSPTERYSHAGELVMALRQVAETRAHQKKRQKDLAHFLAQAQDARKAGDWLAVQHFCVQVMQIDREHPDILEMMEEATSGLKQENAEEAARKQRAQRYEEGERALAAGQWQAAIAAFEDIAASAPNFLDVQGRLAQARIGEYQLRGIISTDKKRARVITLTGPSGSGKSTTVRYLLELAREDKNFNPVLVPKFTTRSPHDDDRGEMDYVEGIPDQCDLIYEQYGTRYGVELSTIFDFVAKGESPIVILNDVRAVEDVRNALRGLVRSVFIFRQSPSLERYRDLAKLRGMTGESGPERLFNKAQAIYRIYIENIHLFDHVIINGGTFEDLEVQVRQIIKGLKQDLNWPLRKRG